MRLRRAVCTSLIIVPMVAAFTTVRAQGAAPLPIRRFGLTAGINSATFGGKDAANPTPDRHTGLIAGVFTVVPMRPNFAIQPELFYTMKGAEFSDPTGTGSFKMNYLELPVLARFDIPASVGVKPFVVAGPAVSFKMTCDVEAAGTGFNVSSTCDELQSQSGGTTNFNSVDYGVVIGGGLAFDVSGRTFTVGARYNHSFGRIEESSDTKHRVISMLATFEFPWAR
jgi:hypothetical protein